MHRLADEITRMLLVLAEVLANPREVTETLVLSWVGVLSYAGIRPEQIRPAATRYLATEKFFPTPAEFLRIIDPPEDRDAAAELAWQRTLTVIRRYGRYASLEAGDLGGDGAALWAIERVGWGRLGTDLTEENRAIWRAEFVRVYHLARQQGESLAYLPGQWERENLAAGREMDPALAGRPDWPELPAGRTGAPALPEGQPALAAGNGMEPAIPEKLREWAARP